MSASLDSYPESVAREKGFLTSLMCGITGYISQRCQSEALLKSLESIRHRGPDGSDVIAECFNDNQVGLGHARLAIIDLSDEGKQPMASRNDRYVMVYNGELYNFEELKKRLSPSIQETKSDSRVMIELFSAFGASIFDELNGIFAAAFYDRHTGTITLVRDHLGVKPLYYMYENSELSFSSEVKGLKSYAGFDNKLDYAALYEYLSFGYVLEPNSGVKGVRKVPPGCYVEVCAGDLKVNRYSSHQPSKDNKSVREVVESGIRRQLISDAKIGVFFSGGADSSLISVFSRLPNLFISTQDTTGIDIGASQDLQYAEAIAQHLNLDVDYVKFNDAELAGQALLNRVEEVAAGIEDLVCDYTFSASDQISNVAKIQNYKVMLSGMGADEMFLGYNRHKILAPNIFERIGFRLIGSSLGNKICSVLNLFPNAANRLLGFYQESEFCLKYARLLGYLERSEIIAILGPSVYERLTDKFLLKVEHLYQWSSDASPMWKAAVLDEIGFLSHNLTVADKSSMRNGIELRVPFLDIDIVRRQKNNFHNRRKYKKIMHKRELKALLSRFLPRRLIYRKKQGFNPSLDRLITGVGEPLIRRTLVDNAKITPKGLALSLVDRHFSGKENCSYKIWQLLFLEVWISHFKIKV